MMYLWHESLLNRTMSGPLAQHRSPQAFEQTSTKSPLSPSCAMQRFLIEPPLSTRKEALKRTPRLVKSASRLTKTQPRTERTLETLVMKYPHARIVSAELTDAQLDPLYDPTLPITYLEQVYEKVKTVGHGSFGTVYHVKHKVSGEESAVKCLTIPYRGIRDREEKLREVLLHEKSHNHENILKLKMAWEEWDQLYIMTELCQFTMAKAIELSDGDVPEPRVWDALIDMANALHHMHSNNLIHNDIKPENVFINENGICKLGDFGMAVDLNSETPENGAKEGDSQYLAAEVLTGIPTFASDIFSLGLTILQLATDLYPPNGGTERWHDLRNLEIDEHITAGISKELRDLLFRMMDPDPSKRPTAEEMLTSKSITSRTAFRTLHRFCTRWQSKLNRVAQMIGLVSANASTSDSQPAGLHTPPQCQGSAHLSQLANISSDFNRNFDDDEDILATVTPEDQERMRMIAKEWEMAHSITPPRSAKSLGIRSPKSLRKRLASMRTSLSDRLNAMEPEEPSKRDHRPPILEFD
uniref:non-specific serine/threonine protein kinase n=1 Tax=Bursaphelenchus xylophilus TaxID=6326 RepID=A0A1I7RUJ5_BURXY